MKTSFHLLPEYQFLFPGYDFGKLGIFVFPSPSGASILILRTYYPKENILPFPSPSGASILIQI